MYHPTRRAGVSPLPVPLQAGLLAPLGLLALLAVVPIVVLYLIRPDPQRVTLPTLQFLDEELGTDATNPLLERLRRNLLLLLQILVVVLLAVALSTPFVTVPREQAADAARPRPARGPDRRDPCARPGDADGDDRESPGGARAGERTRRRGRPGHRAV